MSTQNDQPPGDPVRPPRLSGLEVLNARLRRERLLFVAEILTAHGHPDPAAMTVSYAVTPDGPVLTGVTINSDTWDSPEKLLGHTDREAAAALKEVLDALIREDHGKGPQRGHQRTYLLPTPERTELAYALNGYLYVPEGSVVSEPTPGQPLTVTLPGGETFILRAVTEGQTEGVQLLEGVGTLMVMGTSD